MKIYLLLIGAVCIALSLNGMDHRHIFEVSDKQSHKSWLLEDSSIQQSNVLAYQKQSCAKQALHIDQGITAQEFDEVLPYIKKASSATSRELKNTLCALPVKEIVTIAKVADYLDNPTLYKHSIKTLAEYFSQLKSFDNFFKNKPLEISVPLQKDIIDYWIKKNPYLKVILLKSASSLNPDFYENAYCFIRANGCTNDCFVQLKDRRKSLIIRNFEGKKIHRIKVPEKEGQKVNALSLNADGTRLAYSCWHGLIESHDFKNNIQTEYKPATSKVSFCQINPAGTHLLTADMDQKIIIWDTHGVPVRTWQLANYIDTQLAWIDKTIIVRCFNQAPTNLSKLSFDEDEIIPLNPHVNDESASFALDTTATRILSLSSLGDLTVYDINTHERLNEPTRLNNNNRSFALCFDQHDSQRYAYADKYVHVCDLRKNSSKELVCDQELCDLIFSNDGDVMIGSTKHVSIKIWNISLGQLVCSFRDYRKKIFHIQLTPNNNHLITRSEEGMNIHAFLVENDRHAIRQLSLAECAFLIYAGRNIMNKNYIPVEDTFMRIVAKSVLGADIPESIKNVVKRHLYWTDRVALCQS